MTNQELRARTAILPEFASMAMNAGEQLQDAQLSKGFVPMELQPLVDEAITGAAPTFSDRPLTDLELSTLDTWFVAHPEKIAGTQIAGSGYIAPVRTRGNMEELEKVFAFFDEPLVQSSEFNVQSEPVLETKIVIGSPGYGKSLFDLKNENLTVEQLREQEKAEYNATDPTDEEIYDRYDKLITPLLEKEKAKIKAKAKAKALVLALELEREREEDQTKQQPNNDN